MNTNQEAITIFTSNGNNSRTIEVIQLLPEGISIMVIGKQVGISRQSVNDIKNKYLPVDE